MPSAPSRRRRDGTGPEAVRTEAAGLWCRRGTPPRMERMHRHDDIELNLVVSGELHYVVGGRRRVVRAGEIAMFWAAQPHGLVGSEPGDVCWVHVPLTTVAGWSLPAADLAALVRRDPLVLPAGELGAQLEARVPLWVEEIADPATAPIALLEIEATIRRVLRRPASTATVGSPGTAGTAPAARGGSDRVVTMAQHVAVHFREPLTVPGIAAAAHLGPSRAMDLFRREIGVTLGQYLTMCRVAEAQRLLLTTDLPSTEVASAAGFGSLSSYSAHVGAACGMSPSAYRRTRR